MMIGREVFRIMAVVPVQAREEEEDMIVIRDQEALIIEILALVIIMEEVAPTYQSLTTQEITDNTEEEIQGVVEEDFQEVARVETITYLGAHKPIETIEVAAHLPGVITKVAMGNMELVEAIFLGPQAHHLHTAEVGRQEEVGQQDGVEVGQQEGANHYLEMAQAQVIVGCKTLPIGAEVGQVHPDLPYSVNPQI